MAWGAAFNGQNVSAFNGGAVAEEEDERTVASQNDSVSHPKGFFQFGPREFVFFQSGPRLKCNWILVFPRHFQASPWI
jgi:hypothetical protein